MKKFVFLLCIELFLRMHFVFSQTDSLSLHLRHDSYSPPLYVLDGLLLDSTLFFELSFEKKQIKKTVALNASDALKKYGDKGQNGVIEVYTKVLIVLNGTKLLSCEEKVKQLSYININQKNVLKLIRRAEAIEIYGKQAKYGAIQIDTGQ